MKNIQAGVLQDSFKLVPEDDKFHMQYVKDGETGCKNE